VNGFPNRFHEAGDLVRLPEERGACTVSADLFDGTPQVEIHEGCARILYDPGGFSHLGRIVSKDLDAQRLFLLMKGEQGHRLGRSSHDPGSADHLRHHKPSAESPCNPSSAGIAIAGHGRKDQRVVEIE